MKIDCQKIAAELGDGWGVDGVHTSTLCKDLGDGYHVLVIVDDDRLHTCVRCNIFDAANTVCAREYLTPFIGTTYEVTSPMLVTKAIRLALAKQLEQAERACAALRRVVS